MNFLINVFRVLAAVPFGYVVSTLAVGFPMGWLNEAYSIGQWTIPAIILLFVSGLLSAYCYMGVGLFIFPAKNWFAKLILAIPYFLICCVLMGLISGGTMFFAPEAMGDLTILPYVWETGLLACGAFGGLVKGFQIRQYGK